MYRRRPPHPGCPRWAGARCGIRPRTDRQSRRGPVRNGPRVQSRSSRACAPVRLRIRLRDQQSHDSGHASTRHATGYKRHRSSSGRRSMWPSDWRGPVAPGDAWHQPPPPLVTTAPAATRRSITGLNTHPTSFTPAACRRDEATSRLKTPSLQWNRLSRIPITPACHRS
jgi:hypothetical protein